MGSSPTETQSLVIAIVFGAVYLLVDALRFFIHQLGPVRLRKWSGDAGEISAWFGYRAQHFALLTGAVLQICLAVAVVFTTLALRAEGLFRAAMLAIVAWAVIAILWKLAIAIVPEDYWETLVNILLPVSHALYLLFWPLIFPLRFVLDRVETRREEDDEEEEVTEEQLRAYIDVGEEEGILEEGEGKLVQSIVDFGDRLARELMTPRIDMQAFDVHGTIEELARLFSESKYARIPVYDGTVDRIVGIVHIKDLFDAFLSKDPKSVREIARRAYVVPESKRVNELLREFQIEHLQIAVVVDEFGGTSGLITIEDIVEEIVGDISDEHEDSDESIVEVDHDVYLVNGVVRVDTLEEKFGTEISGDDYETVAGLIFTQTGRVPKAAEQVRKGGLIFEVDRADRKRIYRVKVWRDPEYIAGEEEARG